MHLGPTWESARNQVLMALHQRLQRLHPYIHLPSKSRGLAWLTCRGIHGRYGDMTHARLLKAWESLKDSLIFHLSVWYVMFPKQISPLYHPQVLLSQLGLESWFWMYLDWSIPKSQSVFGWVCLIIRTQCPIKTTPLGPIVTCGFLLYQQCEWIDIWS